MDKEEVNEVAAMITAVRKSVQEAYNITKILEHVATLGDDIDPEIRQSYWDMLYDCAKHIRLNLDEYSFGYVPIDLFDEEYWKDTNPPTKGRRRRGNWGKNYV